MTSTPTGITERPARRTGPLTVRLGLLALTAIGIMGAAAELAFERHWQTTTQLIPWAALVLLVLALVLIATGDSPGRVTVARWLALAVLLASAYGVFVHVNVNHGAGAFDPAWDGLPPLTQWWYALTKSVGDAPPLAPGMLAQSALLLLLTTLAAKR
ncbi:hypothetical protein [Nonomuraea jiangxiensis]|uniref:Uncharacterized protein n=1 Tax=Nonomuraea jiangxiensis TaxID=633440 RepID=A0A1G8TXM8_9ACTN|nr:hypothetical protein [Nonomuraea jiangxiensis]SDJ46249.1 hypothetical protein SAMN05421869_110319 [Nonomuraea jiangxiensis]